MFASLLALLLSWSLSSPVGSSADEDFHLGSIWCAHGPTDSCKRVKTVEGVRFAIPASIEGESCYLAGYDTASLRSAACLNNVNNGADLVVSERVNNVAGYYPPGFFWSMNILVGHSTEHAVLKMRAFNAVLGAVLLSLALLLTTAPLRRSLALGLCVGLVPFGLFYIPSVNPSSWVIIGVSTCWVFLLSWLTSRRAFSVRGIACLFLAGVSALIAAVSRSDGAIYIVITCLVSIGIAWREVRPHLVRLCILLIPIPLLVWALAFRINAIGGVLGLEFGTQTRDSGIARFLALLGDLTRNTMEIPALIAGALGANKPRFDQSSVFFYGVGSIDVQMPSIVSLISWGAAAGILFCFCRGMNILRVLALLIGWGAVFLIPLLTVSRFQFQYAYSPRYIYPLVLAMISLSVLVVPWRMISLTRGQSLVLGTSLFAANAISLLTVIRRYTNGQSETWLSLFFEPEWWWSIGLSPQVLWLIGSCAGVGIALSLARIAHKPAVGASLG